MIRAMSYGKTWIIGSVSTNVYRLPQTAAYYADTANPSYGTSGFSSRNSDLMRDARNTFRNTRSGADTAINLGPVSTTGNGDSGGLGDFDIVAVYFTSIGAYGGGVWYAGLAGGGNFWDQNANYTSLYVHEWGHNYGLGHASFWYSFDGWASNAGASIEYGDEFDVMGSGPAPQGHYHPQGKAKLNWLTTAQWSDATATGSGTYRLFRGDDSATVGVPRGVRVTRSTAGGGDYYWLGYRALFPANPHLAHGVYLTWQRPGQTRCWLLDTTPATLRDKSDAPIDLGRTFTDPAANLFFTPVAQGGTGSEQYLDVRINLGPFPGNLPPTAAAIDGPATVSARANATFAVAASDPNGDALAYYWTAGDGSVNANTNTLTRAWTVGGTYTLNVTVSDLRGGTVTVSKSVVVTDPLDTWSSNSVGTLDSLRDVVFGKGRYVAVEYWGGVYTSWDGVAWTSVGQPPAFDNEPSLAFGNSVFVLAGRLDNALSAQLAWSADGRVWRAATFPAGVPPVQEVAFGNGRFLAVADGGAVLSSTNGSSWSLTSVPGAPNFRRLTFDGTAWLAVALNAAQSRPEVAWTSADGVSWTQRGALGIDTFRVFGRAGTCYALGWYAGVLYSTDHGVSWQDALLPAGTRWTTYRMAAADDGTLLVTAAAMDESGSPYALLVSRDGRTWSRTSVNGGNTAVGNANAMTFGNGKFLTVEDDGVTRAANTFYPNNTAPVVTLTASPATGVARQPIYFAASATDTNGDALTFAWDFGPPTAILDGFEIAPSFAFGGSFTLTLRVSDGRGGMTTVTRAVTITDPARIFTQRTSGTTANLYAIAANTNLAVAVGSGGLLRTSPDGVTWTARSVPEYAANMYFHGVAWDGARFVVAGEDYSFSVPGWVGLIYTSADGTNWTQRYRGTATGTPLNGVAASATVRVAVGDAGSILRSPDGTNWTRVTVTGLGTAQTLADVAFGGGVFTLTGYTGGNGGVKVFTSTDGAAWFDRSTGAGVASWQDLRRLAYLNNRFVASGWYSQLRVSTDGGQTFSSTRSVVEETPALAFGDGLYFAGGVNRNASDAKVDVLSRNGVDWFQFPAPTSAAFRRGATFFRHTFLTVGDGGQIWQSGDLTPPGGFVGWQARYFPDGGLASLADRDPDGDGRNNQQEYLDGTNPLVAEAPQTITFGPLAPQTYRNPPVTLVATASSGLPVSFRVLSGPATVSGNTLTLTGAGSVTVRAQQAGNAAFLPAPPVDRILTVAKAPQTLTFGTLGNKVFGETPFAVAGTATSGLAVQFSVVSGPAVIATAQVTLTGVGAVQLRAAQPGNSNYLAATSIDRVFSVVSNVPLLAQARAFHTATRLANGRVLVTGGSVDGTNGLASTEIYSPQSGTWTNAGGLAVARFNHSATVLTNGRVLVVGGISATGLLASAELFDPATGAWTAAGGLAIARQTHGAALLLDGRVLVAGGGGPAGPLNSVEIYNPALNQWSAGIGLSVARDRFTTTVLADGKVLVAGGYGAAGSLDAAETFDSVAGTWSATGALTGPRAQHTATLLADGRVLLVGGFSNPTNAPLFTTELFNPATRQWTAANVLGTARAFHSSARLADGRVLVAGGYGTNDLASREIFDPATGLWNPAGTLAQPRRLHSATALADGRVLFAGGVRAAGAIRASEEFAPLASTSSLTTSLVTARQLHTATRLTNDRVLLAGGSDLGGGALGSAVTFDSTNALFTSQSTLGQRRFAHTAEMLADGRVLVAGGYVNGQSLTSAELSDAAGAIWTATGSLTTDRRYATATRLLDGRVLVVGGYTTAGVRLASAEIFNPLTGTWSVTGSLLAGRFYHAATRLADGRVLVAGGISAAGFAATVEIFNPATGTWSTAAALSSGRERLTLTTLADGRVVAVGGFGSGGALSLTQIFDPATGTWSAPKLLGNARALHTATLLPDGRVVVIGGGYGDSANPTSLSSVEVFNPATSAWTIATSLVAARHNHTATLLHNGKIYVVGGYQRPVLGLTGSAELVVIP